MIGTGVLGAVGALAVAFGILILTVLILRRVQNVSVGKGCRVPLRLLKRLPVGRRFGSNRGVQTMASVPSGPYQSMRRAFCGALRYWSSRPTKKDR